MFFKLALKNIKRSIKDYAIYFFTLMLGVAIFYVFNAIETQTAMLNISSSMLEVVDLMTTLLSGISVFVAFVLGFLILYASRFLIKRRSKEFGLYLTFGMSKRKISRVILIETFIIGLVSLAAGLLLGIAVSQLTSALVANLFEANLTQFAFVFSASACIKTMICFAIIYLVVMVFNTVNVSRQKLINLLSGAKRNEKIKVKNPWICTAVFIVAALMLAWAYYAVTGGIEEFLMFDEKMVFVVLATGGIATFLLFWSLSGLLLRIFMSWKSLYYRRLNSFVLRQFSSKINTAVLSMTMICLMLFVTICVFSSAMSIRNSINASLAHNLPMDVSFSRYPRWDDGKPQPFENDLKTTAFSALEDRGIDLSQAFSEIIEFNRYEPEELTLEHALGSTSADVADAYGELSIQETAMYLSDYNKIARLFGNPELELSDSEYAVVADYSKVVDTIRNPALASGATITLNGRTLQPKYSECQTGAIEMSAQSNVNVGIFVIPDSLKLPKDTQRSQHLFAVFKDEATRQALEDQINAVTRHGIILENGYLTTSTRQDTIDRSIGLSALVTFVGLYLGMIFLISSAAILALKELSESSDNRQKFSILRKIGASESMLNRALFWQIAIFFGFPLLIAVIHSIFGMMFCSYVLEAFGNMDLFKSILLTALLIVLTYGGYFLLTYLCSKNIIRAHRS